MAIIMGTAGHIDHGKTSLVKALTGIDCDRLQEEKKRGITIELGFAFLDLPGDIRLGVVDVPGHERFVKNMVAGAAGIDFVLLVIAADEGVMPQTREHLEICTLLGIQRGLVALTKVDMVEEEWLELVQEDVRAFLEPTFLAESSLIPVSAHKGIGLENLRQEIAGLAREFHRDPRSDVFRLPIDRVFTMRGHGTVATGTLVSGTLKVGEELEIAPNGLKSKVRGLQVHSDSQERAEVGQRTAVNLHGLEVEDLERGMVLSHPGTLYPSTTWDLELTCLSSTPKALKHRTQIHFHHGTREILARIYFLDRDKLEPGDTAMTQVRFEEPMVGMYGDRCVLRSFSPLRTVAGGKLINPLGRKVKRHSATVGQLAELAESQGDRRILLQLELAGLTGLTFGQLRALTCLEAKELEKQLQLLGGRQEAFLFERDSRTYVHGRLAQELCASIAEHVREFHRKEPMKQGISRGALASGWGRKLHPKLFHFILERTLKQGALTADGDLFRLPEHKVSLASDQVKLRGAILRAYQQGGLTPPNVKDVLTPLDLEMKEAAPVFRLLQEQGELVKVKEDMFFSVQAMERIKEMVKGFFQDNPELEPADFRTVTGLSRKYTIPLLEYLDKEKMTVRVGDKRRLRS
ncbi:selenocysteine-specific translation elongation factor [Desulfonatronum thioautotrophicum]|uniref:selenocysteine-specific translation elongation factor n=1 Tax=Desulfonatronum thioautotrophicum TaxID=617001 RepID=UPI0005EB449F|nr:selenocysteine-specific translation elongation factor [Desulfonatronum thioautotrophicum]